MMRTDRPVLMFDSGIGGLTVLREARVLMPGRRFIYVADDAGFPYGNWQEPALRQHVVVCHPGHHQGEHDDQGPGGPLGGAGSGVLGAHGASRAVISEGISSRAVCVSSCSAGSGRTSFQSPSRHNIRAVVDSTESSE